MNRKILIAIFAFSVMSPLSAFAQGLTNPGFEEPKIEKGTFKMLDTVTGWKTTDEVIEIWGAGFQNVDAHEGNQFAELNANIDGTLYQDSAGIEKGATLEFIFAHRGRNGEDTMELTITDLGADNSPGGVDANEDKELFKKQYTTGNENWEVYDSTKEPKILALGNTVRFAYTAVHGTGGSGPDKTEGNFLDLANFGVGVVSKGSDTKTSDPVSSRNVLDVPVYAQQTSQWCWAATCEMIMEFHKKSVAQCQQVKDNIAEYKKWYEAAKNAQAAVNTAKEELDKAAETEKTAAEQKYNSAVALYQKSIADQDEAAVWLEMDKKMAGKDCCNAPDPKVVAKPHYPEFHRYGFTETREVDALSFEKIKQQIDARQPIAFRWAWKPLNDGGAHWMVLTGYNTVAGIQMVKINDPWPNNDVKTTKDANHSRWMTYSYWCESSKHKVQHNWYDIHKE